MAGLSSGWLVMKYDGPEHATVQIKIGDTFYDAYLDNVGTKRVCKIRPPEVPIRNGQTIELWVNGGVLRYEKFSY